MEIFNNDFSVFYSWVPVVTIMWFSQIGYYMYKCVNVRII